MSRRGEYGFDGNNDRRTCRGGAANENDKIAPPHGSPSSRGPYPISQRCVVHHSNFGALCRLGVKDGRLATLRPPPAWVRSTPASGPYGARQCGLLGADIVAKVSNCPAPIFLAVKKSDRRAPIECGPNHVTEVASEFIFRQ
jgi:hypothetical protein